MSKIILEEGARLGNQCFINLAASLFCEKHNLFITYNDLENQLKLGLNLFVGEKYFEKSVLVNDKNYIELYEKDSIDFNVIFKDYFQSKKITSMTHNYLYSKMKIITSTNKFKYLYNNNNNCFIHVRLGDVQSFNPGFKYYNFILSKINVDKIYLSTDDEKHEIVKKLINSYPKIEIIHYSLIDTILFASTSKYLILSHGTFSGIISYMSFYSKVYFIKENENTSWDYFNGNEKYDIFKDKYTTIENFNEIDTENISE